MKAGVLKAQSKDFNTAFEVIEKEIPTPKKGEVLIKVARAACNPGDVKMSDGSLGFVFRPKPNTTMGLDYSGIVSSVPEGTEAEGFTVGDRVCGFNEVIAGETGSFAEYTCVKPKHLFKIPTGVTFEEAAALPMVSCVAFAVLKDKLKVASGQKMLIYGGSSAIGLFSLSMARDYGVSDIVCTSTAEALCKSFGATKVINYRTTDVLAELKGQESTFDCALDTAVGYSAWQQGQKLLKNKTGKFCAVVVDDGREAKVSVGMIAKLIGGNINRSFWSMCGYPSYISFAQTGQVCTPAVSYFLGLQAAGKMPSVLDASHAPFSFDTDGLRAMMTKQQSGTCKGKLIMNICPDMK